MTNTITAPNLNRRLWLQCLLYKEYLSVVVRLEIVRERLWSKDLWTAFTYFYFSRRFDVFVKFERKSNQISLGIIVKCDGRESRTKEKTRLIRRKFCQTGLFLPSVNIWIRSFFKSNKFISNMNFWYIFNITSFPLTDL